MAPGRGTRESAQRGDAARKGWPSADVATEHGGDAAEVDRPSLREAPGRGARSLSRHGGDRNRSDAAYVRAVPDAET
ncbi:hypothetical protein GCM10022245_12960 [Streptomyces mayteni]